MEHTYLGNTIQFDIKYKNRTSIGISIDGYGRIEVQAPKGTSYESVLRVLEDNWVLIQEKVNEMQDRINGSQEKLYVNDESFLYLGDTYPIEIIQDKDITQDHVVFDRKKLYVYVKELENERYQQALKRYYFQQCKSLVETGVTDYQRHFKNKPRSIRITDSKTNWGTCDSQHHLTFNWRLAMAPREVIDYVVVHEMCHMVHLNHDRSFWRLVGKIMPDYKEKERWLALSNWKMTI
ncbi:M48 family metallopeptidase [Fredinandcohnia sp. 179-A 10B2 NHS]|uniref:M48 family metallopeptidase n=1 Tax=Fredinandcohnia sp. 179-A 10B2 NHS TaxID=3235176 RepID=UPI0039A17795